MTHCTCGGILGSDPKWCAHCIMRAQSCDWPPYDFSGSALVSLDFAEVEKRVLADMVQIGCDLSSGPDVSSIALQYGKTVIPVIEDSSVVINRQFITGLNANRKSDRDLLAGIFTVIAEARSATVERRDDPPNPGYHGRSVALRFACEGVEAMLDIDSLHGGRYSLISWHNHYEHRERGDPIPSSEGPITRHFAPRFNICVGATHSARPHHKATSCGADWYSIAMYLDAGLQLAIRGEAFTA